MVTRAAYLRQDAGADRGRAHDAQPLGTGYTPSQLTALRAAGGPLKWFNQQLAPSSVTEASVIASVNGWYRGPDASPGRKWQRKLDRRRSRPGSSPATSAAGPMLRRIYSTRTVLETMVGLLVRPPAHPAPNNAFAWPCAGRLRRA